MTTEFLYWALVTLFGLMVGLIVFIWQRMERRQEEADSIITQKVGRDEFREFQSVVYGFRDSIHALDVQLAAIKEQILRYSSDVRDMNRKLDRLLERREKDRPKHETQACDD